MQIFSGLFTAVPTPFLNDRIDSASFLKVIKHQVKNRINGVVVCGSTGEGNNITKEEYKEVIETASNLSDLNFKVIAGCCVTSTRQAIELATEAQRAGASGIMCTIPPYMRPEQSGMILHIKSLHDAVDLPIMIYNNPSRTGASLDDDTLIYISHNLNRVTAIKDSGNDLTRAIRLKKSIKSGFNFLTGDDHTILSYQASGGMGWVSVASNIAPALCKKLWIYCEEGKFTDARNLYEDLIPLYRSLFLESNPIPVKYAASLLGLCNNELRLPLTPANTDTRKIIEEAISRLELTPYN
jgi:4-hydroxy-tetrahydrodipicolinate synthase